MTDKGSIQARRHELSDGTLVIIELREDKVYGRQVHDWQAWCVIARSRSIVGSETLLRGGSRDSLLKWAADLTDADLSALAKAP